jgi:hypothetical protein
MSCRLCSSTNEAEFPAEMMIHFSGRKHLENPGVLTFPEILVCLDCGSTRFRIAETELKLLRKGSTPLMAAEHMPRRRLKVSQTPLATY